MAEFVMPKLGADMSAGTLVAWRKKPGDTVRRGEIMADVETDKGVIEVEIFASGSIEKLLVQPGEKVPVGTLLALIRESGAGAPSAEKPALPSEALTAAAPVAAATAPPSAAAMTPAADGGRLRISPSARRLARERGVDPSSLRGTGPGGAVTREDIERAAATPPAPTVPPVGPAPLADRAARMRQSIAAAMARSKREIPHYYLQTTIDFQPAMFWLAEANLKRPLPERLLYGVLLLKAVALALREVPELNATWDGERLVSHQAIHLGVAIALRQGGLIAPALHDVDQQDLDQLMRNFRDLVNRARAGTLRSSELADPTITVTSLGEHGVETVFGVIYPPQTAIVGFGKLTERPWSVAGQIVSRPLVNATLSADHRVTDGHRGALFLAAVDRLLQQPGQL